MENEDHEHTDQTAAARADRDHASITALGITTRDDTGNSQTFFAHGTTRDDTGNSQTFFAHGTELCEFGKQQARRDRADWLKLPTVGDGMAVIEEYRLAGWAADTTDARYLVQLTARAGL